MNAPLYTNAAPELRGDAALEAEARADAKERAAQTAIHDAEAQLETLSASWRKDPTPGAVGALAVAEQRLVNAREAFDALRVEHRPVREAATREKLRRQHADATASASAASKRIRDGITTLADLSVQLRATVASIETATAEQESAARLANEAAGLLPGEALAPVMPTHSTALHEERVAALRAACPANARDPFGAPIDVSRWLRLS